MSRVVQHFARFFGKIRKVAAVKPDPERFISFLFELVKDFDCVGYAAF